MLKRKKYKLYFLIVVIVLIISLIIELRPKYDTLIEKNNIDSYLKTNNKEKNNNYAAILDIPKINLMKGLYNIKSKHNNINESIQIINPSQMPDIENGNLILASHSGTSQISFFKNLYKLKLNDNVYIFYNNYKYSYKITKIYNVLKNGSVEIIRDKTKTTLTLITCHKTNEHMQMVIIAELVNKKATIS